MKLNRTDIKILHELQKNGRITNVELSELVNLSPSPCLIRSVSAISHRIGDGSIKCRPCDLPQLFVPLKTSKRNRHVDPTC
jgi:hypothetical protein